MGLDARDSRLNIAFILGDANVPDNVNWDIRLRDKTAVWLDFVDMGFSTCKYTDADKTENKQVTKCVEEVVTTAEEAENTIVTGTVGAIRVRRGPIC